MFFKTIAESDKFAERVLSMNSLKDNHVEGAGIWPRKRSWQGQFFETKKSVHGRRSIGFGVRVGYWPCKRGPYLQLAFWTYRLDIWWGI